MVDGSHEKYPETLHDFPVAAVIIHIGLALRRGDVKLHPSRSSEEAGLHKVFGMEVAVGAQEGAQATGAATGNRVFSAVVGGQGLLLKDKTFDGSLLPALSLGV